MFTSHHLQNLAVEGYISLDSEGGFRMLTGKTRAGTSLRFTTDIQ